MFVYHTYILFCRIIPVICVFIATFNGLVDGYSLSGFCHISMYNRTKEFGSVPDIKWILLLVLSPQCLFIILYFILGLMFYRGMKKLCVTKKDSTKQDQDIQKMKNEYFGIIILIIVCKLGNFLLVLLASLERKKWDESLKDFLSCKMKNEPECNIRTRQNIGLTYLYLLLTLLPGMLIYYLPFDGVKDLWIVKIRDFLLDVPNKLNRNRQPNAKRVLKKSQIIQKAFEKRQQLKETGRLSISISNQQDPIFGVGSKFGESQCSEDFSSTWARALPR